MLESIIAGIISAIVFAGLVFVTKEYIWPKVMGAIHRTPDISGKWEILNPDQLDQKLGDVKIVQRGSRIKANYTLHQSMDGTPFGRDFRGEGEFHAGQLVFTYEGN